jgi:hypothetical protein
VTHTRLGRKSRCSCDSAAFEIGSFLCYKRPHASRHRALALRSLLIGASAEGDLLCTGHQSALRPLGTRPRPDPDPRVSRSLR